MWWNFVARTHDEVDAANSYIRGRRHPLARAQLIDNEIAPLEPPHTPLHDFQRRSDNDMPHLVPNHVRGCLPLPTGSALAASRRVGLLRV
jgi:hypothetical protein